VPNVWSLHIRDAHSPMCFTNGKGSTKESALASALGEFIERLSCNHFYNDQFWGEDIRQRAFVHYPNERWFKPGRKDALPARACSTTTAWKIYNPDGELRASHLFDTNSGKRGARHLRAALCAPVGRRGGVFPDQPDRQPVPQQRHERRQHAGRSAGAVPVGNLRAGGEARNPRRRIALPDVPPEVLAKYPGIVAGIEGWKSRASRCWSRMPRWAASSR
jgi:ribosomal protein S12 methylthiotransferase accessory factor